MLPFCISIIEVSQTLMIAEREHFFMKKTAVSIFLTLILIFLQITPTFAAVRRAQDKVQ